MNEDKKLYREPWHTILRVWTMALPVAIVLAIIGAILYLLYTWSVIAGSIATVVLVYVVGMFAFAALAGRE